MGWVVCEVTLYLEYKSKIFFAVSATVDVSHTVLQELPGDTVPCAAVVWTVSVDV